MKCSFVCFSKYQLLNCINIINSFNTFKDSDNDLFINAKVLVDNDIRINLLVEQKFFSRIFVYEDNINRGLFNVFNRIAEIVNPYFCIKNMIKNNFKYEFVDIKYDMIFVSYQQSISIPLSFITKKNNINYYDDGLASYYDDRQQHKRTRRLIYKFLFHDLNKIKPTTLYVYDKSILADNIISFYKNIVQIPKILDEKFIDFLLKVFSIKKNNDYYKKRIIFLTQPNDDKLKSNDETNKLILLIINKFKEKILIRKHPRIIEEFNGYNLDNNNKLWELSFIAYGMQDFILIGNSSTAQITPKLLFDIEPILVFTFNLYKNMYSKKVTKNLLQVLKKIKYSFRDTTKVNILNNEGELLSILSKTTKRNCNKH